MDAARYDEFWEELKKALGSAQWSRHLLVSSLHAPKIRETTKEQHNHHDDNNRSQEQEYLLLLDLNSHTLSLLTSTTAGSRKEDRKGSFYSVVLDPEILQACQEEIIEYDNMADFASEFAGALQGEKTVSTHVQMTKSREEKGAPPGPTAPMVIALRFDTEEETMSIALPCLQEGMTPTLLPALCPFFHFDAATGIGRQPAAVEEGKEKGCKPIGRQAAAAGLTRAQSEGGGGEGGGGGRGGGRGGGGGGQRVTRSLIHPRLQVRQSLTGSKWEDEDEEEREGRKRKKKGEVAEESKEKGKGGLKL
ncbi:Hypothetical protein NocV09_02700940 [Nannochloropsis oceanica]